MLDNGVRRLFQAVGLTPLARRLRLWIAGDRRTLSIDGATATLVQRDFGDFVELNQVGAERDVLTRVREEARGDDVFLDVGSNLGVFAVFVGDVVADGTVLAVEPVPETAAKLAENVERNGVDATVCRVVFSDADGEVAMNVPDSHGSSAVTPDASGPTVRRVRGDAYLDERNLSDPTILKIDVEGHETAVLRGLDETLSGQAVRLVYCEVHGDTPANERETAADVRSFLAERGFAVERIADLPGHRHVLRAARE